MVRSPNLKSYSGKARGGGEGDVLFSGVILSVCAAGKKILHILLRILMIFGTPLSKYNKNSTNMSIRNKKSQNHKFHLVITGGSKDPQDYA